MELQNFPPGFAFLNVLLEPPHIWVVASRQSPGGSVVLLMLSSKRSGADTACVLGPKDYSELTHDTVVVYGLAEVQSVEWIRKHIQNGFLKIKAPLTPDVVKRVQKGAFDSKRTPRRIRALIRECYEDDTASR